MPSFQTYYVALGCLPQQTSKRDDRRHAGAVEEQDGSETLQTERVPQVTQVERELPLHIKDQPSKNPGKARLFLEFHCFYSEIRIVFLLEFK